MRLYKLLKNYSKKNIVPMHMPGHKRRQNIIKNKIPYNIDITEIDGFDNLHNPQEILKDCIQKVTNLYKTKQSFYLINGSTCGILASIKCLCNIGDKIILPRNCHKSVYHIIELLNLNCVYLPVETDEHNIYKEINVNNFKKIIESNKDAKCVVLTSPTYEGVISDIKSISKICHKHKIPLIVDEAHGAHLYFNKKSAIYNGADIVINSLHKTLPSLTQTAVLHICSNLVDVEKMYSSLAIFESSSPSYILMSSIDECIEFLSKNGDKYYQRLNKNLSVFKNLIKNLKHLEIINYTNKNNFFDFDETKIVICTSRTNINGFELMNLLRKNKIELEMSYSDYVIAMATIFDTKKNLIKFAKVLINIDKTLSFKEKEKCNNVILPNTAMSIYNAKLQPTKLVNLKNAIGNVCAEYVWAYPPGIPILVPGEVVTKQIYDYILHMKQNNITINCKSKNIEKIYICKNLTNL